MDKHHRPSPAYGLLLVGLLALVTSSAHAFEEVIEERQEAYSELDKRMDLMRAGLQEDTIDWASLEDEAERLKELTHQLQDAFTDGSDSGSRARSRIWSNWDDFRERLEGLDTMSAEIAVSVEERDAELTRTLLSDSKSSCRSCHWRYRSFFSW